MGSVTKLAPIADVNSGIKTPHMNMTILINMVGQTIYVERLTMMPHGATLRIQINDGKNAIVIKPMVKHSDLICTKSY